MEKYGYGVDIGGTTVKLGFFTDSGELLEKWEIHTDTADGGASVLPDVAKSVKEHMAGKSLTAESVLGVGIGVPGPVSGGVVNGCINLGWGVVDVEGDLSRLLDGMKVRCTNDANIAALGELWMGGGRGTKNLVFATLGTGVGGGVVIDGKIVNGVHGAGGEIGHLRVNDEETLYCNCGCRGCMEQYASATGLVRMAKKYIEDNDAPTKLRELDELDARGIWDAAKEGDAAALEITGYSCDMLGKGLAAIAVVADPEVFVIGGGVSRAGQPLIDRLKQGYLKFAHYGVKETRFELASLGNDAGIYGGMYMLL